MTVQDAITRTTKIIHCKRIYSLSLRMNWWGWTGSWEGLRLGDRSLAGNIDQRTQKKCVSYVWMWIPIWYWYPYLCSISYQLLLVSDDIQTLNVVPSFSSSNIYGLTSFSDQVQRHVLQRDDPGDYCIQTKLLWYIFCSRQSQGGVNLFAQIGSLIWKN